MLGDHKLILDAHSEVYRELLPWADGEFWNLDQHRIIPGAVYVFCRESVNQWAWLIRELAESGIVRVVVDNAAEGSETLVTWCAIKGLADLVQQGRIVLISGGDMGPRWKYLQYEYFLPKILDFDENVVTAQHSHQIFDHKEKPYKFLFLNGRLRSHRKYLLERFALSGLLDQALWTNLDTDLLLVRNANSGRWYEDDAPDSTSLIRLDYGVEDLMERPISVHYLPAQYEAWPHRKQLGVEPTEHQRNTKSQLFNHTWGDAIVDAAAYRDTYFSLVTETVFNYPYSFRTEKIWKPIAVGHPFIAVANRGFYRDLHRLGFRTFGHVIDESFDTIDRSQDRIERIATIVEDLCQQDLAGFLDQCQDVCKYNQQLYAETRHRVARDFPDQFRKFIDTHFHE